jgi:hypothetical protein
VETNQKAAGNGCLLPLPIRITLKARNNGLEPFAAWVPDEPRSVGRYGPRAKLAAKVKRRSGGRSYRAAFFSNGIGRALRGGRLAPSLN